MQERENGEKIEFSLHQFCPESWRENINGPSGTVRKRHHLVLHCHLVADFTMSAKTKEIILINKVISQVFLSQIELFR